jgi:hypothetical protein
MTVLHDETMLTDTIVPAATAVPLAHATLFAFRLRFIYFGLYVITTQMISSMVRPASRQHPAAQRRG